MATKKSNYKVRFRHGVYPNLESQATRADIKKYDYFFGNEQVWVETPRTVDFVDESNQIGHDCESPRTPSSVVDQRVSPRRVSRLRNAQTRCGPAVSRRRSRNVDVPSRTIAGTSSSRVDRLIAVNSGDQHAWHMAADINRYESSGPESVSSFDDVLPVAWADDSSSSISWQPTTIKHSTVWPFEDPFEAHLLRFWVDQASRWLDTTSSDKLFQCLVPALSSQNSMLLNSILMYSAQHIQRFQPDFPANPYFYHERLLQELIPHLAVNGRIEDEGTLVAAMLLRAFEEYHAGTQGQTHLSTYELFQGPGGWLFETSNPLVRACLMMHVRFEIQHALLNRPSLRIDYSENILGMPNSLSDDVSWENRIMWLTARVLQWAGKETDSMSKWSELVALVDEWEVTRPASFKAFSCDYSGYYPELWMSSPYHATANVYLQICRITLAVHAPAEHSENTTPANSAWNTRYEALKRLKEMIACTRCDKHAVSTPSLTAHAIHRFAVILSDDSDRQKMIEYLEEVDAMGWWPAKASIRWLLERWRHAT